MTIKHILFIIVVFLISCSGNVDRVTNDTLFSITTIKGFPDDVDGCSCYFSESKEAFKKEEYLFVAGFGGMGYISIDNKREKIKLVSTTQKQDEIRMQDHVDILKNATYTVTVDIKFKKME